MTLRLVLVILVFCCSRFSHSAVTINEFNPNPTGTEADTSFFEFLGTPGESMAGLGLVLVDADTGGANLVVNNVVDLGALGGVFDANGLLAFGIEVENPSYTVVLTDAFGSFTAGQDLDADENDAIDDFSIFGNVDDAIGISDSVGDESNLFAADIGGTDLVFPLNGDGTDYFEDLPSDEPQIAFRDRVSLEWFQGGLDFALLADAQGNIVDGSSFDFVGLSQGGINPTAVPEPGSLGVIGLGLFAFARRRRRC